jgi:hypothetical protein
VVAAIVAGALTSVIAPPATRDVSGSTCYAKNTCATTTTLKLSAASVTVGSENTETFTATVKSQVSGTGNPTPGGTVVVKAGTTTVCTITLSGATGTCSLTASQLAAGSYSMTGVYSGDTNYKASTSTASTLTVNPAPAVNTTTTLALSAASVQVGSEQTETFTVTVTAASGTAKPSGTFQVNNVAAMLCSGTLNSSGVGTCSLTASQLAAGSYTGINATYPGVSGKFNSSKSANSTLTVTAAPVNTSTTLGLSAASVQVGSEQVETFTVTVKAATGTAKPTGTFQVNNVAAKLCGGTLNSSGVGTCSLTASQLAAGSYTGINASYPGATGFNSSKSANSTLTVTAPPVNTSTTLALSAATVKVGDEEVETFTVTVKAATGTAKPTGTFQVNNVAAKLCGGTLTATGVGTCSLTASQLAAGSYTGINATYPGVTGKFNPSKSVNSKLTVTASPVNTSTTLALSAATVKVGSEQLEKFTVTVKAASGTAKPSGTFSVNNGTTKLCGGALNSLGVGTCNLTASQLKAGTYTAINASYAGVAGKFNASKSASSKLIVTAAAKKTPTVALKLSSLSVAPGHESGEKFTVTIKAPTGDTNVPTGTVTIFAGTKAVCTIHLVAANKGIGSCNLGADTLPTKGKYAITASYSGDTNFNAAKSAAQTLTVT